MEDIWTASTPRGVLNKYTGATAEADAYQGARVLAATGHVGERSPHDRRAMGAS
jgi:hypothetical protein